ncbi:hypothetical protein C8Q73DRAFT_245023 [Cubamyces lactineus]|nr:hypothetical protein C8Q73DRAFT_245023 [Cubamyces lactineus]
MWQAAIQHMMQSPGQFQRMVQAFANQQPAYSGLSPAGGHGGNNMVSSYDPASPDYGRWFSQPVASSSSAPMSQSLVAPSDDTSIQMLMEDSSRMQRTYRDANEIDADIDMLQTSIDSLIQNLGIDPGSLAQHPDNHAHPTVNGMNGMHGVTSNGTGYGTPLTPEAYTNGMTGMAGMNGMGGLGGADNGQPDRLLDSLLSQIGDSARMNGAVNGAMGLDYHDVTDNYDHNTRIDGTSIEDASTEQLTAFLDEASSASASSEATPTTASPLMGTTAGTNGFSHAQKRKSIDVPLTTSPELGTGRKVKRKR